LKHAGERPALIIRTVKPAGAVPTYWSAALDATEDELPENRPARVPQSYTLCLGDARLLQRTTNSNIYKELMHVDLETQPHLTPTSGSDDTQCTTTL
jgi:hypothetical protein